MVFRLMLLDTSTENMTNAVRGIDIPEVTAVINYGDWTLNHKAAEYTRVILQKLCTNYLF